jgi:hypothetical protein
MTAMPVIAIRCQDFRRTVQSVTSILNHHSAGAGYGED